MLSVSNGQAKKPTGAHGSGRFSLSPATQRLLSVAFSVGILAYLGRSIASVGWDQVIAALPRNPLFYLLFIVSYMALPVSEFAIFRRWWPLGWRSIAVFSRKRVLNDAVLGYAGDAYLFMWAKRALGAREVGAGPLAAVKDVAIMSALAGNVGTLLMLALALSLGGGEAVSQAFSGAAMRPVGIGFAIVTAISLAILLFSRRVMSLSAHENLIVFGLHCARLALSSGLLMLAWIIAIPQVPAGTWVVLEAMRLVVARLPFLPNKDLLFAAISVSLTGAAAPQIAALMAAAGALFIICHAASYLLASLVERHGSTIIPERLPHPAAGCA